MRVTDWELKFREWSWAAYLRPFVWGKFDCALMAAECVELLTGKHPRPDLIDAYHTPLGAYRVIGANGGLAGICDAHLNRIPPAEAGTGDIALGKFGRKESLMVSIGSTYLLMGKWPELCPKWRVKTLIAWRVE